MAILTQFLPPADKRFAWGVVRFYAGLSGLWIITSDAVVYLHGGVSRQAAALSMGKGLLFVACSTALVYLYMVRQLRGALAENQRLRQKFAELSKYASDAVFLFSESGAILEANDRAAIVYGYPLPELLEKNIVHLHSEAESWRADWDALVSAGELYTEALHRRADGSLFPVEISWKQTDDANQKMALCIVRDISERKEAERQIVRLKDAYAALSQTNQCIVRTDSREELFQAICKIAIQFGHLQVAWIGLPDDAEQKLKPVAWDGANTSFLDDLQLSLDPESPLSKGPSVQAILSAQPVVSNDTRHAAAYQLWHPVFVKHGLQSSASFPLFVDGRVIGVLSIYSRDAGYFTQELLRLFMEMASDISFALDRMEAEAERKRLAAENEEMVHNLIRLKDAYAALSQTNQWIVRINNRQELFQAICGIAIQFGHLQLAWIGLLDEADQTLKPVAWDGEGAHYLEGLQISVDPASPLSKGPIGTAFRTEQPSISNDMQSSTDAAPWHVGLVQHGLQATAAFPLFVQGRAIGALALYSSTISYFTPELLHLFMEMAGDISYALDQMEVEAERKKLEAENKEMVHRVLMLRTAVEQSPVIVVITDAKGSIEYVNPAFTVVTGYSEEEVYGENPRILKSGETSPEEYAALWKQIRSGQTWSGTFHNKRKDGSLYWDEATISPVHNPDGAITQFIAVKQDVTARREAEEKSHFLAFHDPLTRLPNRLLGRNRMEDAIRDANETHCKAAVLFIDGDQFKRVNDSLGHAVGDHLLQALSERIKRCIRDTDTLSRLGGDEFLVILSKIDTLDTIHQVVARIHEQTAMPFRIDGFELSTSVSIGIAIYPDDGSNFDELQRRADLAMYCAKKDGRNTNRTYEPSMEEDANEYFQIARRLHGTLDKSEFVLYYQPQLDMASGKVVGAEALIRWNHPEFGLLMPERFISIAEDGGLIVEIGNWVLYEACRQMEKWRREGHRDLTVAVNLSALQFRRGGLPAIVRDALSRANLDPRNLELELTESVLIDDSENATTTLKELKSIGVSLALDDFGTGYSSFTYLKDFYLDKLKIDQSFIRNISTNRDDEIIVHSITQLAKNFGLVSVAEGVESRESLEIARKAGCDQVQGFLFAKPMDSRNFLAYLGSEHPFYLNDSDKE